MARFATLASSSAGNCVYVGNSTEGILIDAGISCKQICLRTEHIGIDVNSIKAVFLTHEHFDHTSGVNTFARKFNIPVYSTGGTFAALNNKNYFTDKVKTYILPRDGTSVNIGDINIFHFSTYHDAKESCGYKIYINGSSVCVFTDSGKIDKNIYYSYLCGSDLCYIESNYDEFMLKNGPYDPALKRRVLSEIGHISNDLCAKAICSLVSLNQCHNFILGHLSPHNNKPDIAFSNVNSTLKNKGFKSGIDYTLSVAPADCANKIYYF